MYALMLGCETDDDDDDVAEMVITLLVQEWEYLLSAIIIELILYLSIIWETAIIFMHR